MSEAITSTPTTLPALIKDSADLPLVSGEGDAKMWDIDSPTRKDWSTNIDLSTITGSAKLYRTRNEPAFKLKDKINLQIEVVEYVSHYASWQDDNGEIISGVRIVLIAKDGSMYATSSGGVRDNLTQIIGTVGRGPWNPPLLLTPQARTTSNGLFQQLWLKWDESNQNKAPQGARKGR